MTKKRSLLKFGLTGVGATVIHVLVVSVLIPYSDVDVGLANGIAFAVATVFSNFVNTRWSFQAQFTRQTTLRFWVVALAGCGLSVAVSSIANMCGLHYLQGVALVVVIVPIVSFVLHSRWTYRSH